ncbi:MAG: hypothetical protein WA707_15455, partial [Pseudolabrys sp.]
PAVLHIHLSFRTDAVKKLRSRQADGSAGVKALTNSFVILIAVKTTEPARSCDFQPKFWGTAARR